MRLSTLTVALMASAPSSIDAFAPSFNGARASTTSISAMNEKANIMEQTRAGVLSTFAASAIFLSSVTGPVPFVEPANASTPAAVPVTKTTSTTKDAKAAAVQQTKAKSTQQAVVDPLASQKASIETAKKQLASASAATSQAKSVVSSANTAYAKATASADSAQKKVVSEKKALIAANDKLADAKAREGAGKAGALKEVESLAVKVGELDGFDNVLYALFFFITQIYFLIHEYVSSFVTIRCRKR